MSSPRELISIQQRTWAQNRGIRIDEDGYTLHLKDNLFLLPSRETREEFKSGRGSELGTRNSRGKMQALHSSSALVVNVFEYWRSRDIGDIARVLGAPSGVTRLQFEQRHPTGLGGTPPHIDVELRGTDWALAIESKFCEPYQPHARTNLAPSYFSKRDLWAKLPRCERLAKQIYDEDQSAPTFTYLDAVQLLKHILGLVSTFGPRGYRLVYLWYQLPSFEAEQHLVEIKSFQDYVGEEVLLMTMTYQELFEILRKLRGVDKNYITYLGERYFQTQMSSDHHSGVRQEMGTDIFR